MEENLFMVLPLQATGSSPDSNSTEEFRNREFYKVTAREQLITSIVLILPRRKLKPKVGNHLPTSYAH